MQLAKEPFTLFVSVVKLKFHGTDSDFLADFRARIRCSRPAAAHAARSARRLIRGLLSDARFSSRGCPLGMRACTRVRVRILYMINYRVHVYKITR